MAKGRSPPQTVVKDSIYAINLGLGKRRTKDATLPTPQRREECFLFHCRCPYVLIRTNQARRSTTRQLAMGLMI
jgi:hypothetical protein